jgi:cholest-4-en-3-one 26-monooxygenase
MDDPAHQQRRSLVNRGFTPKRVGDQEPKLREFCRSILNSVCERGECDFVWDVAARLPLMVIADMLGLSDMQDELLRWSEALMRPTPAEPPAAGENAIQEFRESQLQVIADRRRNPRDDLMTTLCEAEIGGQRLDDESIVYETLLILIGGDETTRHVISGGMLALLESPDQMADLRNGSADLMIAVEEMIRWVSPIQNMARTVTRDLEFRDQKMGEGDQVILFYPSANRDEDVFADPHRFDIHRAPNPHLSFGIAEHFCLGVHLARLEGRVFIEELLDSFGTIELVGEARRTRSNPNNALKALPLRLVA